MFSIKQNITIFQFLFPRQFWYVLLQISVTPKRKSGIGPKLKEIKKPSIVSLINCLHHCWNLQNLNDKTGNLLCASLQLMTHRYSVIITCTSNPRSSFALCIHAVLSIVLPRVSVKGSTSLPIFSISSVTNARQNSVPCNEFRCGPVQKLITLKNSWLLDQIWFP